MAGDEAVAALGGDPLELADLLLAHLGPGPDPAAHRHLALDVLGQVGRVEGEHETSAADRAVQADHETLMARRVPGREDRGDPRRDLRVTLGRAPVDPRVVEIHPEDAVVLRAGRAGEPIVQFGPLDVHRHPPAWSLCRWLTATA